MQNYNGSPYPNQPMNNGVPYPNQPMNNSAPYPNQPMNNSAPYPNQPINNSAPYPNQPMNNNVPYPNQPSDTGNLYSDNRQYGYSDYYKKSPAGFIAFCIIMVTLIVTEFILFIYPGTLTKKYHDKLLKDAGIVSGTEQTTEATTTQATTEATTATTQATTEATTATTTESTTAATTEATTQEVNLNTTALPSRTDFSWYMDNWHNNGIPADAVKITDYSQINGDWKMMYWWDPDQVFDAYAEEYGNASLSWNGSSLSLTYKFGVISWSSTESYDESDIAPQIYTGNDTAYGFELNDQTYELSISGLEFYSWNGAQYAFGVTLTQSGDPGTVLLVRP